jgi:multiple sugar transport system ATP-binding protein
MAGIELRNVSKVFRAKGGEEVRAVSELSFAVAEGELLAIVGPSGCGKTTTLRLIAGLEETSSGEILMAGASMSRVAPQDRNVAMVFQRDALYPHMTVFENMAFGLRLRKTARAEVEQRVHGIAQTLGIAALLERHPRALSGGERQRAALGRALVRRPRVLLLDEPLSHLDTPLRTQLRGEISRLHQQLGLTTLYVTHDQSEAMAIGQRIAVMNHGVMQQIAELATLREKPANEFVANFVANAGDGPR